MDYPDEMTVTQRAALITVRLLRGERLSNSDVARLCGYGSLSASYCMMVKLSVVLPLYFDYSSNEWTLLSEEDHDPTRAAPLTG